MYKRYVKRIFDILISLLAMPFIGILIIFVGTAIFLEDRGSIFYKARRRGINGTIFEMYKFRSMKMNAPDIRNEDNSTYNSPDDPRITRVGRFLRKTSIDELPQFINVLRGEMSMIGPRPVTTDRPLDEYDEKRKLLLLLNLVLPDMLKLIIVILFLQEEKLAVDAEYAQNVTFLGDCRIVLKTIQTVLLRKNVYAVQSEEK